MKRRLRDYLRERRERLGRRLLYGSQKRYFRCPACHAVQSAPAGRGQTKLVCRRCGEIFLRRT